MHRIKKHPLISGSIIVVIIIIIGILLFGSTSADEQTITVRRADYVNRVSVSGKVVAAQISDLGFDQSGRVATVQAAVGDKVKAGTVLASIENGSYRADVAQKQATLEKERANLAAAERGTRNEELAVTEQTYTDASSALIIAMRNAHLETEGALLTKVDTLFTDGNTDNPEISVRTRSFVEEQKMERDRIAVGRQVAAWKASLTGLSVTTDSARLQSVRAIGVDAMEAANTLIDQLAAIVGDITTANSGITQADIDVYRASINSAGTQVGTAATAEQAAYTTWTAAERSLALKRAGSTAEDVSAKAAQVRSATADVESAQALLRKTLIIAPFDGIVTKMDLKVGQVASPSTPQVAMMSSTVFEIDSYIPEVYITQVAVDNSATLTLDAFGSDRTFAAKVISVDPAETVRDGISTYKTKLRLDDGDPRIRSGMTANIQIVTEVKKDIIAVPQGVITTKDGVKYVRIKRADHIEDVPVTVGGTASFGQVEIVSGLTEGDIIVFPVISP